MKQKRQNTHRDGLAETAGQRPAKCRTNKKSNAQRLKEILTHSNAYDYEWKIKKHNALEGFIPLGMLCDLLEFALSATQIRLLGKEYELPEWKVTMVIDIYRRK